MTLELGSVRQQKYTDIFTVLKKQSRSIPEMEQDLFPKDYCKLLFMNTRHHLTNNYVHH